MTDAIGRHVVPEDPLDISDSRRDGLHRPNDDLIRIIKEYADKLAARGIMEAGHQGAGRMHAMGLNILLPFEQESNAIIHGDPKLVYMKYFFTRKLMLVKECDAVVCLPGGFGTIDEAMEVLTLLQTGKRDLIPVFTTAAITAASAS